MSVLGWLKNVAAAATVVTAVTPSICSADAMSDITSNGKIRISIDPAASPYSRMDQSGDFTGSEVDIARKLAKDWALVLELVPTTPANRIPYLVTGRSDIVISTLSITDERKKVIDFSKPYSAIQIVVGAPKTDSVTKLQDLQGKRVAVTRGSTNDAEITKVALPGTDIVRFEDDATSITALISGQANYYVTAPALLTTVNASNPNATLEPKIVLKTNVTGIGVKKGETALTDRLNGWIQKSLEDGSLNQIYTKYFGIDLPPEVTDAK